MPITIATAPTTTPITTTGFDLELEALGTEVASGLDALGPGGVAGVAVEENVRGASTPRCGADRELEPSISGRDPQTEHCARPTAISCPFKQRMEMMIALIYEHFAVQISLNGDMATGNLCRLRAF